jgi:hypothetical protein
MRIRFGLLIAMMAASLLSSLTPSAIAFGGYASAPLNVSATAIAGGIRVGWTTPTDVDTGITGYRVEYSTTGLSGSWTLFTTVTSSTSTTDILGLSQVSTYVRVAATTTAGVGVYGYPWTKLYGTTQRQRNANGTIQYESGFGLGASDPYTTLQSEPFSRVRYLFSTTLTSGGTTNYADVDFYKWAAAGDTTQRTSSTADATIRNLSIPTTVTTTQIVQANVTDMNVFSDYPTVTDSRGVNGRLELWGIDYGWAVSGLSPAGSGGSYDYDDTPNNGSYGSFQVHNMSTLEPVFVWNDHGSAATADINYGLNTTSGANPDSTFCTQASPLGSCPSFSTFRLQIYANIPVTPMADVTPPTVSRIDSREIGKNGDTITVRSTEVGKIHLVNQSVSVTNLASITAAPAGTKNEVTISAINTNTTLTLSGLNDGLYNLYAADSSNNLSTAVVTTIRIDNTAPTASAIAVNSDGTAVVITGSETLTNSLQVYGLFAVTDSGSAISVTNVSFLGTSATLTLSRTIPSGATVYFTYTPVSGDARGRIVDQAGNEMAALTKRAITNNSTSAITVTLTVPDLLSKGVLVTISVNVSVEGRVTFTFAGKRIPGCINRAATGNTPITLTCAFKPAVNSRQIIGATLTPTLSAYPVTTASVERIIAKRSNRR